MGRVWGVVFAQLTLHKIETLAHHDTLNRLSVISNESDRRISYVETILRRPHIDWRSLV